MEFLQALALFIGGNLFMVVMIAIVMVAKEED